MINEEKPLNFDDDSEPNISKMKNLLMIRKRMKCTMLLPKMVLVLILRMMGRAHIRPEDGDPIEIEE